MGKPLEPSFRIQGSLSGKLHDASNNEAITIIETSQRCENMFLRRSNSTPAEVVQISTLLLEEGRVMPCVTSLQFLTPASTAAAKQAPSHAAS